MTYKVLRKCWFVDKVFFYIHRSNDISARVLECWRYLMLIRFNIFEYYSILLLVNGLILLLWIFFFSLKEVLLAQLFGFPDSSMIKVISLPKFLLLTIISNKYLFIFSLVSSSFYYLFSPPLLRIDINLSNFGLLIQEINNLTLKPFYFFFKIFFWT